MKKKGTGIERGQAITFRLPSDTPDHIVRQLQNIKETERRNFSSKMAEFVLQGVRHSLHKQRETVTLPLPRRLSKEQRDWLKHTHSETLLGNIVYQLLADPVRAASVLASLNSNALDIDEALFLQENHDDDATTAHGAMPDVAQASARETIEENKKHTRENVLDHENVSQAEGDAPSVRAPTPTDDDMERVDWNKLLQEQAASVERNADDEEEDIEEDMLGDFLSKMNK